MDRELRVGGLGKVLPPDDEVKSVVEHIKPALEKDSGRKFESLEVIHYRPQVVAGTNYFVKAKAKPVDGKEEIIHLRIYQDIQRRLELTAHQLDRKIEDKLEYFQ